MSKQNEFFDIAGNEESYLIEWLFQLTIAYRDLSDSLEGEERNVALSQINEINHRILNRVRDLKNGEKWTTRESTAERMLHHCNIAPKIKSLVKYASEQAFKAVAT